MEKGHLRSSSPIQIDQRPLNPKQRKFRRKVTEDEDSN